MTRPGRRTRAHAVVLIGSVLAAGTAGPAEASLWQAGLTAGSHGTARAGVLVAPTGVASACVSPSGTQITVSWAAAPRATSYTVLQATDSTGFAAAATGVTGASWTSGPLPTGFNYYYEVTTVAGTWSSPPSSPQTPRRYVSAAGDCS
jgi:hypothetical protein